MCPDEELLSAYVDGEVPSPWKERMERHVSACARCSRTLERYRLLDRRLGSVESPSERQSLEAARMRLAASVSVARPLPGYRQLFVQQFKHLWSERVALPIPVLAAGLVMLIFLTGLGLGVFSPLGGSGNRIVKVPGNSQAQVAWMEAMAAYMKQNTVPSVMIEMPKEAIFEELGRPVIVSAAGTAVEEVTTTSLGSAYR